MAYSVLPAWPLLLFGILEPVALVWGAFIVFQDPKDYINQQVPSSFAIPASTGSIQIVSQLGNVYLLLAGLALLCCFTNHVGIARNYLLIVAMADCGHIYASYLGMGEKYFMDWQSWNSMAWGNVGFSVFLFLNRLATAAGVFGKLSSSAKAKKA